MHSDFLIIGGGVIGLSIARELRRLGVGKILILEKSICAREASWAAAGMLSPDVEAVERDEFYSLGAASRDMYPSLAAELFDETGIDIEMDRTGTLDIAFGEDDCRRLLAKCRKQEAAGIAVEGFSLEEVLRVEPELSSTITIAAYYPNDWQVENRKLLAALVRYAELNEIEIRENVEVAGVILDKGVAVGVETPYGPVDAGHTIIATGAWTSLIKLGHVEMPVSVKPVRGQIVAFQGPPRAIEHVVYSNRGYIVPRADGRVLAGSTSEDVGFDHSLTQEARAQNSLRWRRELPPSLALWMSSITGPVCGHLPVTDYRYWGPLAGIEGLTIATGHYRNGILLAPVTAKLVAEKLVNGAHATAFTTFGPERFRSAAAG